MKQLPTMKLTAGDKVYVRCYDAATGNATMTEHAVKRITPTGIIVLDDGSRYGASGRGPSSGKRLLSVQEYEYDLKQEAYSKWKKEYFAACPENQLVSPSERYKAPEMLTAEDLRAYIEKLETLHAFLVQNPRPEKV